MVIALSIRQPWASMFFEPPLREIPIVNLRTGKKIQAIVGKKQIEIRIWGQGLVSQVKRLVGETILVHASGSWDDLEPGERDKYDRGGIIGTVVVRGYIIYNSPAHFNKDRDKHQNPDMDWVFFKDAMNEGKEVIGIILTDPKLLPFTRCKGALGFFHIPGWDTAVAP